MKIKKDSWHYQHMKMMGFYPANRTNLCGYMRGLIMSILLIPMIVVSPLVFYWSLYFPITTSLLIRFLHLILIIWGAVGTIIFISILVLIVGVFILDRLPPIPDFKIPELKNNIVLEYIKAKKQKICPIIEFQ